jgi:hypothetical protein
MGWRSSQNRVILVKLSVDLLVKKSPSFIEVDDSLLYSQEPSMALCSVSLESSLHPHILFKIHFNITLPSTTVVYSL